MFGVNLWTSSVTELGNPIGWIVGKLLMQNWMLLAFGYHLSLVVHFRFAVCLCEMLIRLTVHRLVNTVASWFRLCMVQHFSSSVCHWSPSHLQKSTWASLFLVSIGDSCDGWTSLMGCVWSTGVAQRNIFAFVTRILTHLIGSGCVGLQTRVKVVDSIKNIEID